MQIDVIAIQHCYRNSASPRCIKEAYDELPPANAPTWFALLDDDLELPGGSTGYVLDARASREGIERLSAADLVGELAR